MKDELKGEVAQKLLEKLGGIDPNSIECICVKIMMKGETPAVSDEQDTESEMEEPEVEDGEDNVDGSNGNDAYDNSGNSKNDSNDQMKKKQRFMQMQKK